MNMKDTIKSIGKVIADNRSNIITALVATGVVSTTIRAIKDTPKVNLMIDEAVAEKGEDLTKKEKVVIYAKGYWKTIAIGTGTLVLLVGNRVLDQKSMTGLVGAYVAAENKIQSIKESIKETVDEETQKKITDKTTEKEIEKNPPEEPNNCLPAISNPRQYGLDLFWDDWRGQWIWTTRERIEAACAYCNKVLVRDDVVSVETFYDQLGVETGLESSMFGWNLSQYTYPPHDGKEKVAVEYDSSWGSYDDPSNGKMFGILRFVNEPVYRYEYYD
jgi:hypothetical protein